MDERTKAIISAVAVIAVNVAAFMGIALDQATVLNALMGVAMLAATVWGVWHNHNFTEAAIEGQRLTDLRKVEAKARAARGE